MTTFNVNLIAKSLDGEMGDPESQILTEHITNSEVHVTSGDKQEWNNKLGKSDLGATSADIAAIFSRLEILEDNVSSLKKTNTEVVAAEADASVVLNDATKDYVISGELKKTSSVTGKSIEYKNINVNLPEGAALSSGNAVLLKASDDVTIKDGSIGMNQQTSSNCVKIQDAETVVIRDVTFTGATYNTVMTGQNTTKFIKNMLIDNCDFAEDCKHINIWFAGHADNAVLTISNCHFKTAEQFLCLSDFASADNKLTVNIINCTIDNYDDALSEAYGHAYTGFMFIESRNTASYEDLVAKNPFGAGKVSINIDNLTVKGTKITEENFVVGNNEANQSMYFYHSKSGVPGCILYSEETKDLFPTITIK